MKKYFPLTSPVPFRDHYETDPFTQEHSLGGVVKSAPPPRIGFYVDVRAVKGVEPVVIAHHGDSLDHDVARLGEGHHYDDLAREGPVDRETQARSDRDLDAHSQPLSRATLDLDQRAQRRRLLERDRFERHVYRERTRREQRRAAR